MNKIKKFLARNLLNFEQKLVNRVYNRDGATDEVIDFQVSINEFRNKFDCPDKSFADDDGFVQ